MSRNEFKLLMEHAFGKVEPIGTMCLELRREIRDGVLDLVSLLNELIGMSDF